MVALVGYQNPIQKIPFKERLITIGKLTSRNLNIDGFANRLGFLQIKGSLWTCADTKGVKGKQKLAPHLPKLPGEQMCWIRICGWLT
jgi:hypothetical protein